MTRIKVLMPVLGVALIAMICGISEGQIVRRQPGIGNRQGDRQGQGGSRPGSEGAGSLNRAGLKIGKALPIMKIYDDQGNEFSTGSIKGSFAVLTFGCLT